jgi:hypothetical protein
VNTLGATKLLASTVIVVENGTAEWSLWSNLGASCDRLLVAGPRRRTEHRDASEDLGIALASVEELALQFSTGSRHHQSECPAPGVHPFAPGASRVRFWPIVAGHKHMLGFHSTRLAPALTAASLFNRPPAEQSRVRVNLRIPIRLQLFPGRRSLKLHVIRFVDWLS